LENGDHGAEHTYKVYQKALAIAEQVQVETEVPADKALLYIMSGMHDSGRFHFSEPGEDGKQTPRQEAKRKKAEQRHALYGVAQIRLASKHISLTAEEKAKIEDYIYNHDFFNTRLDGKKYQEPYSLEGQITRLADRISVPIEEEIQRYWETGKRLGTPYFNPEISWEKRRDFSFAKMQEYLKTGMFDEFTFFLSLLSQQATDFSHPVLAKIYQQRASSKKKGIETILEIAMNEEYRDEEIQEIKKLIDHYLQHFHIQF
jgi:HD superfamily phosphodiesterase